MRGCRFSRGLLRNVDEAGEEAVADRVVLCCWCIVDRVCIMIGLAAAVIVSEMCAFWGLSEVSDSSEVDDDAEWSTSSRRGFEGRFARSARSSSSSSNVGWRQAEAAQLRRAAAAAAADSVWMGRVWAARLRVYICGTPLVGGTRSHMNCLWSDSG